MSAVATIARTVRIIHAPSHGICSNVTTLGHMYKTFSQGLHGETRRRVCLRLHMGTPHHCLARRRRYARRRNVRRIEIRSATGGSPEITRGSPGITRGWAEISRGPRGISRGSREIRRGLADLALSGDKIGVGRHFLKDHGYAVGQCHMGYENFVD